MTAAESSGEAWVVVRDLRTGRVLHNVPTGTQSPPVPHFVGAGEATTIVVKRDGAVAWIVESKCLGGEYQVHALDEDGERVLASGRDIAPRSLALVGSTLYWTQGGKPYSATLK